MATERPARVQVDPGLSPERLRPVASPRDIYIQPVRQPSGLTRLADSLTRLSPSLERYAHRKSAEEIERLKAEGEQQARMWYEEGKTFRDAIDEGLITPDQNPWFRLGAQEFFGRNAANTYSANLLAALATSDIAESTDVADFDAFEREFRRQYMEEHGYTEGRDLAFERSFGSAVDNYIGGIRHEFGRAAGARLIEQTEDAIHSRIMQTTLGVHALGLSAEEAAREIKLDVERAAAMGLKYGRVNRNAAEAIINAAIQTADLSLLDILDHVETSEGNTLATAKGVPELREAARSKISDRHWIEQSREQQEADRARQEQVRTLESTLIADLIENDGLVPDFDERAAEISRLDPARGTALYNARQTIRLGQNASDPAVVDDALSQIWLGRMGTQGVINLLAAGEINAQDANFLYGHAERVEQMRGEGDRLNDPAFKVDVYNQEISGLKGRYGSELTMPAETGLLRDRAVSLFNSQWYDYFYNQGGSEAPINEQRRVAVELKERLWDAWKPQTQSTVTELANIPGGTGAPAWHTQRITTDYNLDVLEYKLNTPGSWTLGDVRLLERWGVNPEDPQEIQRFITLQRALQPVR